MSTTEEVSHDDERRKQRDVRRTLHDAIDRARIEPARTGPRAKQPAVPGGLSATQAHVARVIVGTTGNDGWSWLGVVKIGLRAKLCERATQLALRELEAKGWIALGKHALNNGGAVRAYKVTPVSADLMSHDEIEGIVGAVRAATRARKAKSRMKGAAVTDPLAVTDADVTDRGGARSRLPMRDDDLRHSTPFVTVTDRRAADPSESDPARERSVCDAGVEMPAPTAQPSPQATPSQPSAHTHSPTAVHEREEDSDALKRLVRTASVELRDHLPHLTPVARVAAEKADERKLTPVELAAAIRDLARNEGTDAPRKRLMTYIANQHAVDASIASGIDKALREKGALPPRAARDNMPAPPPPIPQPVPNYVPCPAPFKLPPPGTVKRPQFQAMS